MTKDEALRLALEALENTERRFHTIAWGTIALGRDQDAITAIKAALEAKDEPPRFPTMLRKMWSGGEVQNWINEHWVTPPRQEAKNEPVVCGACNGSGCMVRDPDIGTDQECFVCKGSGVFEDTTPPQQEAKDEPYAFEALMYPKVIIDPVTGNVSIGTVTKPCGLECDCTDVCEQETDYKALWQQMCERCDELDKKLAQRKPLTDEEIERIYHRYGGEMINCARAIERAHGIKGKV